MRKTVLSVLIVLVSLWVNPLENVPASADARTRSSIFVALPAAREHQVWRFDATVSTGTKLGTYQVPDSAESSGKPTLKISPDGKWLASGWIDAGPPVRLELGHVGETLALVNNLDKPADSLLEFGFSPDSRYFAYTLYTGTEAWTLGVIDLQSGKKAEFTGMAVSMPPDIDVSAPFGKMIPIVTAWSPDSQTIYFETFLMLGCRGPHALYSAKVIDMLGRPQTLPSTTLVSPKDANTFSYAFSPDRTYLAVAYDDRDCNVPIKLGVIALQTNQSKELIKASPDRAILVLGWADEGKTVVFTSDPAPDGDSGPGFPLKIPRALHISRSGGGPDMLPDLTTNARDAVENLVISGNTLFYTIATEAEAGGGLRTLYRRPLFGSAKYAVALAHSNHEISLWLCGDALYFAATQGSTIALYRALPGDMTAQKLHEAPQIAFAGCAS